MKIKIFIFLLLPFFLSSCIRYLDNFYQAKNFLLKKNCKKSFLLLKKSKGPVKRKKDFILQAAEFCLKEKQFLEAASFYEYLVPYMKDKSEKKQVLKLQKKIAEIYFLKIKNYKKSLFYFQRFLNEELKNEEKFKYLYQSAEAFYYLKNKNQSIKELEKAIRLKGIKRENKMKLVLFKSRLVFSLEDFKKKTQFFRNQIDNFPEKEEVFRNYLSLIFEERRDIKSAIKELEVLKIKNQETKQRIKKLKTQVKKY